MVVDPAGIIGQLQITPGGGIAWIVGLGTGGMVTVVGAGVVIGGNAGEMVGDGGELTQPPTRIVMKRMAANNVAFLTAVSLRFAIASPNSFCDL